MAGILACSLAAMAATGRRERTKVANRAAILAAGRDVFAEHGYDAVGVRDIVRRTELASGTFYNYFPDKASVFRAIVEETGAEARRRVREARRSANGPEAFLEGGFRAFFEFIAADPGTFAFLRRNLGTIRERFGEAVLPAGLGELEADLREAIAHGDLPGVDVPSLAHAMLAVGLELGQQLAERSPPDVEGATRFATALFSGGVAELARRYAAPSCAPASPSS
jgi:AcrR family transcriptional regulator